MCVHLLKDKYQIERAGLASNSDRTTLTNTSGYHTAPISQEITTNEVTSSFQSSKRMVPFLGAKQGCKNNLDKNFF
jgi:hypothetical protein